MGHKQVATVYVSGISLEMPIPCTAEETPVTWSVFHSLGQAVDALAVTLNTPNYTPMADFMDMPFNFQDPPAFTGAVYFGLAEESLEVTNQRLVADHLIPSTWVALERFRNLIDAGDLFLMVEAEGCWCNTLFQVLRDGDQSFLRAVGDANSVGCCQTLYVPEAGGFLDYGQHVIPAAWAEYYRNNPVFSDNSAGRVLEEDRCVTGLDGIGFFFREPPTGGNLMELYAATRKLEGKFVWPIRARFMQKLWSQIKYIMYCENHGGVIEESVIDHIVNEGGPSESIVWTETGCSPWIPDFIKTLRRETKLAYAPGCLVDGLVTWNEPVGDQKLPWNEITCAGLECEGNGPRIYCETISQLEVVIQEIGLRLNPYTIAADNGCCCDLVIKWESAYGQAGYCPSGNDTIGWSKGICLDYVCEEDVPEDFEFGDPPPPDCTWTHCSFTDEVYWVNPGGDGCPITHTGEPCAAYCNDGGIEYSVDQYPIAAAAPSWSHMWDLARALACARLAADETNAEIPDSGTLGFEEEFNSTLAEAFCSRWRVESVSQFLAGTPAFTASVYIQLLVDDVPIDSEIRSVELEWDAATQKMVGPWTTEPEVALTAPGDNYRYEIVIDDSEGPVKCPRDDH